MKKQLIVYLSICFILLFCQLKPDQAVIKTIYNNIKALENENLSKAMATIDPQSAAYNMTQSSLEKIFNLYDLTYELKTVKTISQNKKEAFVYFTLITKKIDGPAFQDNQISGIHHLKQTPDGWKIHETQIESVLLTPVLPQLAYSFR